MRSASLAARISKLIALPHSVFALPFAISAFLLSVRAEKLDGHQTPDLAKTLLLAVAAVVFARSAAMAFNRLVDHNIDAINPRTSSRELPSKALTRGHVLAVITLSTCGFLFCSALLGKHCLLLAPVVLLLLFGYSYTKRFSALSHFILGLSLAAAPGGAWWIYRPQIEPVPLLLMAAVMFWVAGFDILYSCQDQEFDKRQGLHSIPAYLGLGKAMALSTVVHVISFGLFVLVGSSANLPTFYYIGMALLGMLFVGQHLFISPNNLSRINHAFFTANGVISIGYLSVILWCL